MNTSNLLPIQNQVLVMHINATDEEVELVEFDTLDELISIITNNYNRYDTNDDQGRTSSNSNILFKLTFRFNHNYAFYRLVFITPGLDAIEHKTMESALCKITGDTESESSEPSSESDDD